MKRNIYFFEIGKPEELVKLQEAILASSSRSTRDGPLKPHVVDSEGGCDDAADLF